MACLLTQTIMESQHLDNQTIPPRADTVTHFAYLNSQHHQCINALVDEFTQCGTTMIMLSKKCTKIRCYSAVILSRLTHFGLARSMTLVKSTQEQAA